MFGRVRRLMAKAEAELNHAHRTMSSAERTLSVATLTLEMLQALIKDFEDGSQLRAKAQFDEDAAKKFVGLLTGRASDIPVTLQIVIDPEYDTQPNEIAKFVGGEYDGKVFRIDPGAMDSGELTLAGGHRYVWDGKVFRFQG